MKKFLDLSSWRTALGNLLPSAHGHQGGSRKAIVSIFIAAMLFAACGDEDSSFAPRDNTVSDSDIVAESFDDLPVCSSKREGAAAYVKDEKTAYICTGGSWVPEEETSSSSSETTQSSSSITTATPCNVDGVNNCVTDSRDGKTYRTVKIGDQLWMAENLNYAYTGVPYKYGSYTSDSTSWCYGNDPANCDTYGRLYTWAAAMDSVGKWSTNGKGCGYDQACYPTYPVRGVCPEGWHLPSNDEWEALIVAVDGSITEYTDLNTAGSKLKSLTGWEASSGITNEDAFGFSALPAGYRVNNGNYYNEGNYAFFWSSTEYFSYDAYYMYLFYNIDNAYLDGYDKNYGLSVRCLKD